MVVVPEPAVKGSCAFGSGAVTLPIASLRAAGELTEIRAAELRFSAAEADALLNDSLGLELEGPDVDLLQTRRLRRQSTVRPSH